MDSFLANLFSPKDRRAEYFLALEFAEGKIKASVWEKQQAQVKISGTAETTYPEDLWEEAQKAADWAITQVSGNLPPEAVEKVIFGLPTFWVKENKITSPYLNNLKKLCADLSLKPLGFVLTQEVLIQYLKQKEGVPPTVILVEVQKTKILVNFFRAGRSEGLKFTPREKGKEAESIVRLLLEFSPEVLPSKILLYDGEEDLEVVRQNLLAFPLTSKLPFLHFPKIEILGPQVSVQALVAASASQIGAVFSAEEKEEKKSEEITFKSVETFGFVKEKDVRELEKVKELPTEEKVKAEKPPKKELNWPKFVLPHFSFPQLDFHFPTLPNFWWILGGFFSLFLLLGGGGLWALFYLPKAEVTLFVTPKVLEKEERIRVLPALISSPEDPREILGKIITVEEEATKKTPATGKKLVGEPAKGEVTIYNKTAEEKEFPQSTVLLGPNNLKFTLDESLRVASTSPFSTTFSFAKGKVTAHEIGSDSNLAAQTNFTFKDFLPSLYFAKNEEAFSGGSSQEIPVISKGDQERILATLSGELSQKAKINFEKKLEAGEKLVEKTMGGKILQKKFDKEIEEEGKELTLFLKMSFESLVFSEKNLKEKLARLTQEAVPAGYTLRSEETQIRTEEVEIKKEGGAVLKIIFRASLLPLINTEEIKKAILGKKIAVAEDYFKSLANVTRVEMRFSPEFSFWPKIFPRFPQRIKIETGF